MPYPESITDLLPALRAGDPEAREAILSSLYPELRRIAHRHLRRQPPRLTLGTTALVHEAYLKLFKNAEVSWQDRSHLLAVAARAMRQILMSYWRQRFAEKRGAGEVFEVRVEDVDVAEEARGIELLALDQALERLEELDERLARVVELRFFAGLTFPEVGEVLGVTERSAKRYWRTARAFLHQAMDPGGQPDAVAGGGSESRE
ncbi:MAG: sigma-70 family RNA polymerase sigma factor [Acidobacteria bacterium]|nr:sigma-70 family RNA polymerase sigma factor [Acidobacteriota bacterium]